MKHPGRMIAYGVAVLFVIAGIYLFVAGRNYRQKAMGWFTAKPVELTVDFSAPGEWRAPFIQTCHTAHGQTLYMDFPQGLVTADNVTNLLSEVRFDCRIVAADGSEKINESFGGDFAWRWRQDIGDESVPLISFRPFEEGTYTLVLNVTQGASALRGIPQQFVGRYDLCGLELLPAELAMMAGKAAWIIAALVAGVTALVAWRRRRRENG